MPLACRSCYIAFRKRDSGLYRFLLRRQCTRRSIVSPVHSNNQLEVFLGNFIVLLIPADFTTDNGKKCPPPPAPHDVFRTVHVCAARVALYSLSLDS